MLYGDFVFDISHLQTILFALFAILTLFQGRLCNKIAEGLDTRSIESSIEFIIRPNFLTSNSR
ncbi:hypothetical protein [Leptospira noguchii]|uniref:hypothetical protein n=1 Tax=Leptospira noguchii TaxID=28182 RepID=UPI001E500E08|nr:hypothetical protein [Leptospira noguchii]